MKSRTSNRLFQLMEATMSQKLIFCFDGTSNDPGDSSSQGFLRDLFVKDNSITNILKLHLLLGGDLSDGQHISGQHSFYFAGVGTEGSHLRQIFDATLALPRQTVDRIEADAVSVLLKHFRPGDEVFLFGFSRGAAIARRFAARLPEHINVRFMGVFDTVASIGTPRIAEDGNPASDVVFENKTISPRVIEALHLVSIDEDRKVFRPTLMNRDVRVTELWLPGVHSDVGGGYRVDALSDSALQILLEELEARNLGLRTLAPSDLPFEDLVSSDKHRIDLDDVIIEPDYFGKLHAHDRPAKLAELTLEPRRVCVNIDDLPSAELPTIHWTAADRIYGDRTYRPKALSGVLHNVIMPDGRVERFNGLKEHLERGVRLLTRLTVGDKRVITCNSLRLHNHSGIAMEKGCQYRFQIPPNQTWQDREISCGPAGWTRDDIEKGFFAEAAIAAAELLRRAPASNWFALMGSIGNDDSELFEILAHTQQPYIPQRSGELCSFANDVTRLYSNNTGSVQFTIERIA